MLDIKFIRENKELISAGARKKKLPYFDVNKLLSVDDKRRELMTSIEKKRADQKRAGGTHMVGMDATSQASFIAQMKVLKKAMQEEEEELKEVMKEWQALMLQVPNVPDISVPDGESDKDNVEVRAVGTVPEFSFVPQSHIDIMEKLDLADFEKGAEVAGFRGYFLKNDAVILNFALWQLALDFFVKEKGFKPMMVPSLVRKEALFGTGYLPQGKDDLYMTQDEEYLAGTGEVGTMAYYMDKVIDKSELPIKILAFSPCFRREAGSHGKDTKGIMRVHEFFKLEQVILCEASHEESVKHHEFLNGNVEELMQRLGIPFHTVVNCGGDLGLGQVKKYDVELWIPSERRYREISSASYFHDFQARRLNIRYKDEEGKMKFVHSLNCTALPTPRALISVLENNQQQDGSISIPEPLQPYMGKKVITR